MGRALERPCFSSFEPCLPSDSDFLVPPLPPRRRDATRAGGDVGKGIIALGFRRIPLGGLVVRPLVDLSSGGRTTHRPPGHGPGRHGGGASSARPCRFQIRRRPTSVSEPASASSAASSVAASPCGARFAGCCRWRGRAGRDGATFVPLSPPGEDDAVPPPSSAEGSCDVAVSAAALPPMGAPRPLPPRPLPPRRLREEGVRVSAPAFSPWSVSAGFAEVAVSRASVVGALACVGSALGAFDAARRAALRPGLRLRLGLRLRDRGATLEGGDAFGGLWVGSGRGRARRRDIGVVVHLADDSLRSRRGDGPDRCTTTRGTQVTPRASALRSVQRTRAATVVRASGRARHRAPGSSLSGARVPRSRAASSGSAAVARHLDVSVLDPAPRHLCAPVNG